MNVEAATDTKTDLSEAHSQSISHFVPREAGFQGVEASAAPAKQDTQRMGPSVECDLIQQIRREPEHQAIKVYSDGSKHCGNGHRRERPGSPCIEVAENLLPAVSPLPCPDGLLLCSRALSVKISTVDSIGQDATESAVVTTGPQRHTDDDASSAKVTSNWAGL